MDYRERWELKDYLVGRELSRRIALFRTGVGLVLVAFLLNFWYLQGVRGDDYSRLAETNRLRRIPTMPTRGVIFDGRERVIAATRPSVDLLLLRTDAASREAQLRELAPMVDATYEELAERVRRSKKRPAYEPLVLKEDLELEQLARIESRRERFPSVQVRESTRRSYPNGALFGHVMGYVGEASEEQLTDSDELRLGDIVGKSGLEREYDEVLRGSRGWNLVSVNNVGRPVGGARVGRKPDHGRDLRLTLDVDLQEALYAGLGDEVGGGVFFDPWTGDVLALASTPSFDPGKFADGITTDDWRRITEDPRRPLHDRSIASFYAPGSVFKVLIAVAGLESGAVQADDVFHCLGSVNFYGRRRLCWKRGGHGPVDLRRALAQSCNVYFYQLGKKLGIDPIHAYGARFGLGRPTGIDVPGEASGVLPSREWKRQQLREIWYPGDTISVAIGQGFLAVTPLQMATMLGTVATGGKRPIPHVVRGTPEFAEPLGVAPETLRVVREALRDAVEHGTGGAADLERVSVAGKTGTAQVYRHSAGVDSDQLPKHERDHAWFAGYAPADDPRIAFAVVVEHGGHGGSSAAPIVRRVLEVFFGSRDREMDDDVAPPAR